MKGPWRKSSRSSSGSGNQCVEARAAEGRFEVRDSKLGEASPILDLSGTDWRSFLATSQR